MAGFDRRRLVAYLFGPLGGWEIQILVGAWRSPVAHLLWEQGVGGSNPLAPTNLSLIYSRGCHVDWRPFILWEIDRGNARATEKIFGKILV